MANEVAIKTDCRLAFARLDSPDENGKFRGVLIINETDGADQLKAVTAALMKEHKVDKSPFKTGADMESAETGERYAGFENDEAVVVNFSGKYQPDFRGPDLSKVEADKFYSGCWVRAVLRPYAWTYQKKRGVSIGCVVLQFIKDGDALGAAVEASDYLEPVSADDIAALL